MHVLVLKDTWYGKEEEVKTYNFDGVSRISKGTILNAKTINHRSKTEVSVLAKIQGNSCELIFDLNDVKILTAKEIEEFAVTGLPGLFSQPSVPPATEVRNIDITDEAIKQ